MVSNYEIFITKPANKDKEKIRSNSILKVNVDKLLEVIENNPNQNPPSYEKLLGNLHGMYSRRINRQHRLVYRVMEEEKKIMIISM